MNTAFRGLCCITVLIVSLVALASIALNYGSATCMSQEATSSHQAVQLLELFILAIGAGFVGALMGLGGGLIFVPVLTSVFDIPIHTAITVSIISVIATSISGGSAYVKQRITNIRLAMFLETSTSLGAFIGALLVLTTPKSLLYLLFSTFAFYVVFLQIRSLRAGGRGVEIEGFKDASPDVVSRYLHLSGEYFDESELSNVEYTVRGSIMGWLVSFIAGVGSGMLGIGGGFFKVSAMNLFMNVPLKVAIATSKFMIGVTAATSAIIYYISGVVRLDLVAPVAIGTILGASLGTKVMNRLRVKLLKVVFTAIVCYLGYSMLRKGLLILGVTLP